MQREIFEKAIKGAIVRHAAVTPPERERIYTAARASLKRRSVRTPDDMADLEDAIGAIETTFTTQAHKPRPLERLKSLRAAIIGLFLGVALGAGTSAYLLADATARIGQDAEAFDRLQQIYQSNLHHMPVATDFIRQVVDAVVDRQKKDEASLKDSAKRFVNLAKFDPALAKKMPKSLPPGTAVMVRADATDLKVMMNWTLCGVASISNPEMVDKRRAPQPSFGCPYFGLWTNKAANW